jgi:hypothetical protein
MTLRLLLFSILLAVIHQCLSANVVIDDKISFVEEKDATEAVREKIRSEMEEYKKLKEMSLKKKSKKETTATTTTTTTTTTTPASTTSSSTVKPIYLGLPDDGETMEAEEEITTEGDRFIINAPLICKENERLVRGRCRKIESI